MVPGTAFMAVAALLVLAGCTAPARPFATTAIPASDAQWVLAKIGPGGNSESSHAVSPDGHTILACSHGGFTQPSPLWASQDGGTTFRALLPSPSPPVGGDCDVAILADGTWAEVYDSLVSTTIVSTRDHGATWRFAYIEDPLLGNVDRPWLEAVGTTLYLTYADIMAEQPYAVFFQSSQDGGQTWTPPLVAARVHDVLDTNCWQGHPTERDHGRTIRIPLGCWTGTNPLSAANPERIYFAASQDAGATWTLEPVVLGSAAFGVPTASYGDDGTLWLVTIVGDAKGRETIASWSHDDGRRFAAAIPIASRNASDPDWPWIDARADGGATVTWMDGGDGHMWQVEAARLRQDPIDPVAWSKPVSEAWAGAMGFEFDMVRHDANGRASIVYPMGGDGCKVSPPGTGAASTRNDVCIHLLREP